MARNEVTRRRFLQTAMAMGGAGVLVACGGAASLEECAPELCKRLVNLPQRAVQSQTPSEAACFGVARSSLQSLRRCAGRSGSRFRRPAPRASARLSRTEAHIVGVSRRDRGLNPAVPASYQKLILFFTAKI